MEREDPHTEEGRGNRPASNVVRLPRDWTGPLGQNEAADRLDHDAVRARDAKARHEFVGAGDWLGPDAELVPFGPEPYTKAGAAAETPSEPAEKQRGRGAAAAQGFWGEDSGNFHDAVRDPPAADRRREETPAPRAATWIAAAVLGGCVLIAVAVVLGSSSSPSRSSSRAAHAQHLQPTYRAAAATKPQRSPVEIRRHHTSAVRRARTPTRHTGARATTVEAGYRTPQSTALSARATEATPAAASASAAPQSTKPSYAQTSAPAASPTVDAGHDTPSPPPSQPAGPTGPGALTGAGSTPSG